MLCLHIIKRFYSRILSRAVDLSKYQVEIVPFRYSTIEITNKFYEWCKINTPFLFKRRVSVRKCYLPFWCIEHKVTSTFEGYSQITEYVPWKERSDDYETIRDATLIYAGSTIRRQLLDVIKCDLKASTQLQRSNVENDIQLEEVNLPEDVAWKRIQEQSIDCDVTRIQHFLISNNKPLTTVTSFCEKNKTKLIYLPTYICQYKTHFHYFKVFFSGYSGEGFGIPQEGIWRKAADKFDSILLPDNRTILSLILLSPFIFSYCLLTSLTAPRTSIHILKKTYKDWNKIQKEDFPFVPTSENTFKLSFRNSKEYKRVRNKDKTPMKIIAEDQEILNPLHNHYEVLSIPRNATQEQIKLSFQKIIQKYHPDTCGQSDIPEELAEAITKRVIKAYSTLKDPTKKMEYDKWL